MPEELNILLHDEARLLDWGESRSAGPWIKLALRDPELLAPFRGMDTKDLKKAGHILHVTVAQGDIETLVTSESEKPRGQYGKYAEALYKSKVLATDDFMRAIGADAEYEAWVERQPSVISGDFSEFLETGEGRCVAHHVRRASNSGTGIRGEFITVSITHDEHALLHQMGELSYLEAVGKPADFLDVELWAHRHQWAWDRLKAILGFEHWNEVPPESLVEWCLINSPPGVRLERRLPAIYR